MNTFLLAAALMCLLAVALLVPVVWRRAENRGAGFVLIAVLVLALPLGSVGTYTLVSNWVWDDRARAQATDSAMRTMAAEAETQLQLGDDPDGWRSLARFYMGLEDYDGAARAYGRAYQLTGERDVGLAVAYGEALALADLDNLQGRAGELMEAALEVQPTNARALWYGGLAAYEGGRFGLARERWSRLLQLDPPPAIRELLTEQLAELAGQGDTPRAAPPGGAQGRAPAGGDAGARVRVEVTLDDALRDRVANGASLYLIARTGAQGPPLAVRRLDPGSLPTTFELDQSDVMLPNQRLDDATELHVTARIAQQGDAAARSGDLFGETRLAPGDPGRIVIDQVMP